MGRIRDVPGDLHREAAGGGVRSTRLRKENPEDKPKRPGLGKGKVEPASKGKKLVRDEATGEEFDSVWEALGFSAQESANLDARATLMMQIEAIIVRSGWTQTVAARRCGVSQPRMNELLKHHIDRFSIDALVNMASALGQRVEVKLKAA